LRCQYISKEPQIWTLRGSSVWAGRPFLQLNRTKWPIEWFIETSFGMLWILGCTWKGQGSRFFIGIKGVYMQLYALKAATKLWVIFILLCLFCWLLFYPTSMVDLMPSSPWGMNMNVATIALFYWRAQSIRANFIRICKICCYAAVMVCNLIDDERFLFACQR